MKETNKKIFVSSQEDRGLLVKFLKNKIHLSFCGDESDVPRKIVFSNDDFLELCSDVSSELNKSDNKSQKGYVTNLLDEMTRRNDEFNNKR